MAVRLMRRALEMEWIQLGGGDVRPEWINVGWASSQSLKWPCMMCLFQTYLLYVVKYLFIGFLLFVFILFCTRQGLVWFVLVCFLESLFSLVGAGCKFPNKQMLHKYQTTDKCLCASLNCFRRALFLHWLLYLRTWAPSCLTGPEVSYSSQLPNSI